MGDTGCEFDQSNLTNQNQVRKAKYTCVVVVSVFDPLASFLRYFSFFDIQITHMTQYKRGETPYEQRCKRLKWDTLEKRRVYLSLVECYKTVFNLNGITFAEIFEFKHIKE